MESDYEKYVSQNPDAQAEREHRDQLIEKEAEIENQLANIRKEKGLAEDTKYEDIDSELANEHREIMNELYPEGYEESLKA